MSTTPQKFTEEQARKRVKLCMDRVRSMWFENPEIEVSEKKHQTHGLEWALFKECGYFKKGSGELVSQKRCGMICDEMGLGKTTIAIGTILANYEASMKTLIVVPPALLNQWVEKIQSWLRLDPYVFHGAQSKVTLSQLNEKLNSIPVVITTYSMVSTRENKNARQLGKQPYHCVLWDIEWTRVICDEAHHVRNVKANKHKGVAKLNTEIMWLLTGTPIHNHNNDLYSQLKILGLFKHFAELSQIAKVQFLYPYLLLRTKEGLGIEMPPLEIETVVVDKYDSEAERKIISYVHSLLNFTNVQIDSNTVDQHILTYLNTGHPLPILVRARQACVYPGIIKTYLNTMKDNDLIEEKCGELKVETSTKMRMIGETILAEKEKGNATLVFCYYVEEMEKMKTILEEKYEMSVEMLNGKTTPKQRLVIPKLTPDVLIVQIQSCCEGLNLQQFSSVVFTSPHWNPAVEDQAIARAHRLGQKKPVKVYRFICDGIGEGAISLDRHCMTIQDLKREKMDQFRSISTGRLQEAAAKCNYDGAAKVAAKNAKDAAEEKREEIVAETDRENAEMAAEERADTDVAAVVQIVDETSNSSKKNADTDMAAVVEIVDDMVGKVAVQETKQKA